MVIHGCLIYCWEGSGVVFQSSQLPQKEHVCYAGLQRRGDVSLVLKRMGVQPPARLGNPMLPPELLGMLGVTFDVFRLAIQLCVLYRTSSLLSSTPTSYRHIPNPGPVVSQSPGCVTDSRKNCQTPNSVDSSKHTWARLEATRKGHGASFRHAVREACHKSVSYTHLTLPTILRV